MNVRTITLCEFPLVPLRGLVNSTYWRVHPLYVRHLKEFCEAENRQINQKNNNNNINKNQNNNTKDNSHKSIEIKNIEKKNTKKIIIDQKEGKNEVQKKVKNIRIENEKTKSEQQENKIDQHRKTFEKEENFNFSCCPQSWREIVRTHIVGVHA